MEFFPYISVFLCFPLWRLIHFSIIEFLLNLQLKVQKILNKKVLWWFEKTSTFLHHGNLLKFLANIQKILIKKNHDDVGNRMDLKNFIFNFGKLFPIFFYNSSVFYASWYKETFTFSPQKFNEIRSWNSRNIK